MANRSKVRISGPLAAYVDRFAAELARVGYTAGSTSHQLRLLAHLSGWLEQRGRDAKVDRADLVRFVAERRAEGRRLYVSMGGIAPLIDFLDDVGVLAPEEPAVPNGVEQFIDRYRTYLQRDVGWRIRASGRTCRYESPALFYSVAGRTKILTLSAEEVPAVAAAVARYRTTVTALEAEAYVELDTLVERVHARRRRQRR